MEQPTVMALFSNCIKRRGCTSLQFSVRGNRGGDLPNTRHKTQAGLMAESKAFMEAPWFQLPCIIKVMHNQKCYCFKVSLPAYTLPHTKKLFHHVSSSHHGIFSWYWAKISCICFFFSWLYLCLDTALSAIWSRGCRFGPEIIHGPDIQFGFLWTGLTLLPSSLGSVEVWASPNEGWSSVALLC